MRSTKLGAPSTTAARTIRQVVAVLRRHHGEEVDIAPAPDAILALARGSFAGMTPAERRLVTRRVGGAWRGRA